MPQHVTTELIKLNGIQFNSKCVIVEETKNKPTSFFDANVPRPTAPVFSNHLTDEICQIKLPLCSAKKSCTARKTIFLRSWNIIESSKRPRKYHLSINFLAEKNTVFPITEKFKTNTSQ